MHSHLIAELIAMWYMLCHCLDQSELFAEYFVTFKLQLVEKNHKIYSAIKKFITKLGYLSRSFSVLEKPN